MPLIDCTHLIWLKMMKILISSSHFWVCASRLIFEIGKNDTDVVICWICYVEFDMHAYGYQSCFSCCWLCFEFRNINYNRLLLIPVNLKNGKHFKIFIRSWEHQNNWYRNSEVPTGLRLTWKVLALNFRTPIRNI